MDISKLVDQLTGELEESAYKASDQLAKIGSAEVVDAMIRLLAHPHDESKIMAARTLGLIADNGTALEPLLQAVEACPHIAGELLTALEGFDLSAHYVTLFKYSLFGSFKVSTVAQDLLDHKEFDITPRVLKKITKAWHHYENNVKQDEVFELKRQEVAAVMADLQGFLDHQGAPTESVD